MCNTVLYSSFHRFAVHTERLAIILLGWHIPHIIFHSGYLSTYCSNPALLNFSKRTGIVVLMWYSHKEIIKPMFLNKTETISMYLSDKYWSNVIVIFFVHLANWHFSCLIFSFASMCLSNCHTDLWLSFVWTDRTISIILSYIFHIVIAGVFFLMTTYIEIHVSPSKWMFAVPTL